MKNKGMYIEELVGNTISFYNEQNIGIFEKRYLPIKVISIEKNKVIGYLKEKSYVDFIGLYNKRHIEFETKQTNNDYFKFSLFKEHQLKYLINIFNNGAISFLIIHFYNHDKTFAISAFELISLYEKFKNKKIPLNYIERHFYKLEIIFPGILDLVSFLNLEKNNF